MSGTQALIAIAPPHPAIVGTFRVDSDIRSKSRSNLAPSSLSPSRSHRRKAVPRSRKHSTLGFWIPPFGGKTGLKSMCQSNSRSGDIVFAGRVAHTRCQKQCLTLGFKFANASHYQIAGEALFMSSSQMRPLVKQLSAGTVRTPALNDWLARQTHVLGLWPDRHIAVGDPDDLISLLHRHQAWLSLVSERTGR